LKSGASLSKSLSLWERVRVRAIRLRAAARHDLARRKNKVVSG